MASIAANSVTSISSVTASGGAGATARAGDDAFATMLGGVTQGTTNGKAVVSAGTVDDKDDKASPTDKSPRAAGTPPNDAENSTGVTDPAMAQLLAAQQLAASTAASATPGNSETPASGTASPDAKASQRDTTGTDGSPDADSIKPASDAAITAPDAKGADASTTNATSATDAATVQATLAAALPATNTAASAVVANGATAKPGKSTNAVSSDDGAKSESRNSKASALADASDAITRGFSSAPAVRANALPTNGTVDPDKTAAQNAPQVQHNAGDPASAATPAQPVAAADTVQAAAPTASSHVASQPDTSVGISTLSAGQPATQTAAASGHLSAQIQVSHQAPDISALAVSIAAKSQDGLKHFDIRLDPAELGRVDVRLTVDDAGKAQATLSVEKPQTLELLQKDSSHLERALKDAGLDLAQNGLNFLLKGQQQNAAQDHTPFARGRSLAAHAIAAIDQAPILSSNGVSTSDARLDIRV